MCRCIYILNHYEFRFKSKRIYAIICVCTATNFYTAGTPNHGVGDQIFYVWAAKAGVSAFGTYSGSSGAKTVYLAANGDSSSGADTFTPKMIIIKRSNSTENWLIYDVFRGMGTSGSTNANELTANANGSENTTSAGITTTTGSFSMNSSLDHLNETGGTYIYAAFA